MMNNIQKISCKYEELWINDRIQPKISVIIPVFNVEKYIERCLKSLLKQTFEYFEVIVVNDGSNDSTAEIANVFVQNDKRFQLINQENNGPSFARNNGINEAKGKYITFLDADDWISENYLELLYNTIEENNCDIAISSVIRKREHTEKYRVHYTETKIYETLEDKIKICNIPKCCYVWNKLYKAELIKNCYFIKNRFFEDILWLPEVIKKSKKIATTPNCTYYYFVNKNSIVKKNSPQKQFDSYFAKKYIIKFFNENNLKLDEKEKNVTKDIKYFLNIPILKIKEFENIEKTYLFGFIPISKKKIPYIDENTFIIWEPCSSSHSEVVPGYAKYLLDLGYKVSVIVNPSDIDDGLFSRFEDKNLIINTINRSEVKKYFKNNNINLTKGILVTTAGKICDNIDFSQCYSHFHLGLDKKKLFLVEHDAKFAIDKGTWENNIITLRKLNYKNQTSTVVNPHYFGEVKITPKNDITNFLMIGRLINKKVKNTTIINAINELINQNYTNFKITLIGRGKLKDIPQDLRKYIDLKGRLSYEKMYNEIEKADFILTSYDITKPNHIFYNTTGTSGNFQLVYGFLKPVILVKHFAPINGFDETNSILYEDDTDYSNAMKKAIDLSKEDYQTMQNNLKEYRDILYQESLNSLKGLINAKQQ